MPKDRRVNRLSSDRSRSSPYPCSSNNTEQYKPQRSLGLDENVQKCENVRWPISVDHPHDKADDPKSSLRSTEDIKEWEAIRCPICMEHPHNAVLLQCSSFGRGCRPHMCNTSYRHSNCLDQFRKSSVSSPSTEMLREIPSVSNRTREELQLLRQTGHYESELQPKLSCPLCRGEIYGWTVIKPAREFMNSKLRSCSWENCDFTGNYAELRKHARSDHPFIRPSEVDPQRQRDWADFEYERDVGDMFARFGLTREEQEELDFDSRDFDDLPAMVSRDSVEEDEENEDRYSGDSYQVVNTSNPHDYRVVMLEIQLSMSMLPLDYGMGTSNTSRQTDNFRWNMLPAGYEMVTSHANRRTNDYRWNNSYRSNIPETMHNGLNSYRQNDGFSRNGNFRGNNNFSSNLDERIQRRGTDNFRSRPSERMP